MAISNKKIESYKIIKGSVDSIIYLDFYKENTQLFKTKQVYQDNARIHHAKIVKNYCIENNINILYSLYMTLSYINSKPINHYVIYRFIIQLIVQILIRSNVFFQN